MAGLYIHIPFCVKRCLYCDFYSDTDMSLKEAFLTSVCKEMELRKAYIKGETIDTIYFGGGTPSQLGVKDFDLLFDTIYRLFSVNAHAEITLEANPDDMTGNYIADLRSLPFNRISMGVQSFQDDDLRFLQRRHNREQALRAVSLCKENRFENISIDLIYGLPGQTPERWETNLSEAVGLDVPHISAYHLTYEEGTRLHQLLEQKKICPAEEECSITFFSTLIKKLRQAGYIHYEISNFAKPGKYALHNASYWTGKKYLGTGPSAHSYDIKSRQWNISSLSQYISGINQNSPIYEIETLNIHKQYNDYIVTRLRTLWGISLTYILTHFGEKKKTYCLEQATPAIKRGLLLHTDDKLLLSEEGIFVSDSLMSDLLWV